ncbi:MAG: diiron oxygenase [Gammaproteobacteria bacterium]|nr:diiron oxygenase [Gammaproteobacteria bacterium]
MKGNTLVNTNQLSERLSTLSRDQFYDVYKRFDWPTELAHDSFAMSPEITTLYGTNVWSSLNDEQKRKLTICETATLFSNTLNGEKLLVAGLSKQLYSGARATPEITEYLHHFIDEENKHMIMFGIFCNKYVGRIYPDKKFATAKDYAPGEELLSFYALAMVVEAYGDYYNVQVMKDDRCDPLVRDISRVHHLDEARHLSFDRAYLRELAAEYLPTWDEPTLTNFQQWLAGFMRVNWVTFYNPAAYRDAGIPEPYEVQKIALASPTQAALREKISAGVVKFFQKIGLLNAKPDL